jgi:hypothetical protein
VHFSRFLGLVASASLDGLDPEVYLRDGIRVLSTDWILEIPVGPNGSD